MSQNLVAKRSEIAVLLSLANSFGTVFQRLYAQTSRIQMTVENSLVWVWYGILEFNVPLLCGAAFIVHHV